MPREPIPILTGPTAVGKTALSLDLAEQMGAEIVSADSRQVYRGLDIGTAKPGPEELERVPHHFIDELDLDQPFSAGAFAEAAWSRIRDIQSRGRRVLVVGGSTLYIYALERGLAAIPAVDREVRDEMTARLADEGAEALFEELARVDPRAAQSMDATKTQRLVRALEVYHGTGRPLSSYQTHQPAPPYAFRTFVLTRERRLLYDRINRRVDAMLAEGLLDEVQTVLAAVDHADIPPLRTIGYQEPIAYLRGEHSYETMRRLVKRNSRRYAKRQLTWFRRFDDYRWVDVENAPLDVFLSLQ